MSECQTASLCTQETQKNEAPGRSSSSKAQPNNKQTLDISGLMAMGQKEVPKVADCAEKQTGYGGRVKSCVADRSPSFEAGNKF